LKSGNCLKSNQVKDFQFYIAASALPIEPTYKSTPFHFILLSGDCYAAVSYVHSIDH